MGKQPEISGDKLTKKNKINDFPLVAGNNKPVTTLQSDQGGNTTSEQKILSNVNTRLDLTPDENLPHYGNEESSGKQSEDNDIEREKTHSAKKHAIKAQKAAIMARNMSHNLGSHVMAYLKQQLYTTESILSSQDHVLYDIYDGTKENKPDYANLQLPFLVGLGQFINYLQERQDYIATVATSYIPYPSPIDFKEAIFDGINPDLKWLRHWKPNNQSNKPFNILLNYIAKSEGYTRQPIEIGQKPSNEGRYLQINYVDYNLENDKPVKIDGFSSKSMESAQGTNSISLAIPGGLIGRQAVFSIIENITRNAAKHEKVGNEKLEINIGLIDGSELNKYKEKGWISEEIYDCYSKADDIHNLYLFLITYKTNTKDDSLVLESLWNGINEEYVHEVKTKENSSNEHTKSNETSGEDEKFIQFIETNKGIKEIRISASWLRGNIDEKEYRECEYKYADEDQDCEHLKRVKWPEKEDAHKNKAPLVYVDIVNMPYNTGDVHSLRYIVGIKKQLGVKIIREDRYSESDISIISDENIKDWKIVKYDFEKDKKDDGCYEFVVVETDQIYNNLRPFLNNRVIKWSSCAKYVGQLSEKLKMVSKKNDNEYQAYKAKTILEMLYSVFANVKWEGNIEESEKIVIWDGDTVNGKKIKVQDSNPVKEIVVNKFNKGIVLGTADEPLQNYRHVYRTHHDSEAAKFITENIKSQELFQTLRVEGISGSNSTTRLIRYTPEFNYIWYCKHYYALNQNIAIIDERIFESTTGLSESDFANNEQIDQDLSVIQELGNSSDDDFYHNRKTLYFNNESLFDRHPELIKIEKSNINIFINSISALKEIEKNILEENKTSKSALLSQKGIWVFNIIPEKSNTVWMLVGYFHDIIQNKTLFVEIASINRRIDGPGIIIKCKKLNYFKTILPNSDYFNKITIHQGILDKLYEFAECKKEEHQKQVTQAIQEFFMGESSDIQRNNCRMYIHSGRSKPVEDNMPQIVPFIQFSALDFAVNDSKYSLVEMLDFAKYQ